MGIFPFLEGISPWWWIAFAVALGAVEMATMSFFLIWPGLAALLIGGILAVAPDLSSNLQVALFAILSVVLTFAGRSFMHRYGDKDSESGTLNSRANLMIGRHAEVLDFTGPEGNVSIDGIRWRALWEKGLAAEIGATVEISGAEGMTLLVKSY